MAGKGGRVSTTWGKGTNPVKQKGTKHKKTILKESIGLTNWEKLASFIRNEGAEKLVDELSKLTGREYMQSYHAMVEYVKPKLNRTTVAGDFDNPINHNLKITIVHSDVPISESEETVS